MFGSERMAKIDWEAHKRRRQEEYPGYSVAAYAREAGLNPNTARKFMKGDPAPATSDPKPTSKSDPKSDPKPRKTTSDPAKNDPKLRLVDNSKDRTERSGKPAAKRKNNVKSGVYDRRGITAGEGAARASDPAAGAKGRVGKGIVLVEPLTTQDHTGGYVSFLNMDEDILEASLALAADDGDLTLANGRYLQLFRCKEAARKRAIADYEKNQPWCYPGTETEMPLEMAIMQAETAPAQRLAELERYMGVRKATIWRQRQAEREQHPLTFKERMDFTTEILQERSAKGWSALETAQQLEVMGLELPRSLELEVAREVGFIEPITDTDGGISDEELEAQSRAYMAAQKELMGSWLPTRREEVAAALAAEVAHQNGALVDEDDFNPLPDDEPPVHAGSDYDNDDDDPLTPFEDVQEDWP